MQREQHRGVSLLYCDRDGALEVIDCEPSHPPHDCKKDQATNAKGVSQDNIPRGAVLESYNPSLRYDIPEPVPWFPISIASHAPCGRATFDIQVGLITDLISSVKSGVRIKVVAGLRSREYCCAAWRGDWLQ